MILLRMARYCRLLKAFSPVATTYIDLYWPTTYVSKPMKGHTLFRYKLFACIPLYAGHFRGRTNGWLDKLAVSRDGRASVIRPLLMGSTISTLLAVSSASTIPNFAAVLIVPSSVTNVSRLLISPEEQGAAGRRRDRYCLFVRHAFPPPMASLFVCF